MHSFKQQNFTNSWISNAEGTLVIYNNNFWISVKQTAKSLRILWHFCSFVKDKRKKKIMHMHSIKAWSCLFMFVWEIKRCVWSHFKEKYSPTRKLSSLCRWITFLLFSVALVNFKGWVVDLFACSRWRNDFHFKMKFYVLEEVWNIGQLSKKKNINPIGGGN